jgi:hypothetical protein
MRAGLDGGPSGEPGPQGKSDQGVAVRRALGAGDERGEERGRLGGDVAPHALERSQRDALLERVEVDGELLDRRVALAGPVAAVVEQRQVPGAWRARPDPARVVLAEQQPVRGLARTVGARVPVAREQLAAAPEAPAGRAARLFGGGRVVDDPQLVESAHAEHDQVEVRAVVDRVGVQPVAR